ncbi:MAG TPA: helix-turn-helix transcriptional regulator [Jatrophihabitantaceae bacterium]|jgi:sugar-specific transcriptional regulator TrmB
MSTSGRGADAEPGTLSAVGIGPLDERVYRELLTSPGMSLAELAIRVDSGVGATRQAIGRLERTGLLSRRPGTPARFVPARPDVAVGALIARRHDELERARLLADRLVADFHQGTRYEHTSQVIEIVVGPEAISQRAVQLMRGAEHEVMIFDKPPYVGTPDNPDELDALARGVRWRAVYSTESLAQAGQLEMISRFRDAGEQARLSPCVPTKLAVADHRLALLPLTIDRPVPEETAILVHPSSMLSMLTMHFETVWERAVTVDVFVNDPSGTAPPSANPGRQVVLLLAAGLKDEAIARQLGISLRTVRRWIAQIMAERGATTRFQLGLSVANELAGHSTT